MRRNIRGIIAFILIAFGLAWTVWILQEISGLT